jgi:sensor histidine kinase regulating citrate/malate metabolism
LDEVDIDEINLTSTIGNIIDNAFDAVLSDTQKDKEKIVSLYAYSEEDRYCISISNNGPMIPENDLSRIFQNKFSTKASYEGERGFGLFIVKELVSQNNGRISVTSSELETEFLIEFKIKHKDRVSEAAAI